MSRAATATLAAALALAAGCAHVPVAPPAAREAIGWPPPPAVARIAWERTFATPGEFGIRTGWLRKVARFLAGSGRAEDLARPVAVALADDGRVAVADPEARALHVFDPARSRYLRVTRAGDADLVSPVGVVFDGLGRIWVSDSSRGAVYRFDREGRFVDRAGTEGDVRRPTGLAYDRARDLVLAADALGHALVAFDRAGKAVQHIGHRGRGPAEFNFPVAIAVGPQDRLYVSDSMNHRVQVLEADGRFVRAFGRAGTGAGDFDKSKGIGVDRDGHVYVAEALRDEIQVFDGEGRLLTILGGSGSENGRFSMPAGLYVDPEGRILVADSANRRVQVLRYVGDASAGTGS